MSIKKLALLLTVVAATTVGAATAQAQPYPRTFVSAGGTDTSNTACSFTAPCQTFQHALAETSSGGEINCLTPGGFGALSISQSVTINCEAVSNGGVNVNGGTAVTIGTADITVNLIGLDINGENHSQVGVSITAAAFVNIRNCKIYGFSLEGANGAISYQPEGSMGDLGSLVVDNVFIANNTNGIYEYSSSGAANVTVRNSNINNNSGDGIYLYAAGGAGIHSGATIEQTTLAFNGAGLYVQGSGAIAVLGGSTVVNNTTGVASSSGGLLYSFKNNQIGGNNTDGTPLTAYPGGPLN